MCNSMDYEATFALSSVRSLKCSFLVTLFAPRIAVHCSTYHSVNPHPISFKILAVGFGEITQQEITLVGLPEHLDSIFSNRL